MEDNEYGVVLARNDVSPGLFVGVEVTDSGIGPPLFGS